MARHSPKKAEKKKEGVRLPSVLDVAMPLWSAVADEQSASKERSQPVLRFRCNAVLSVVTVQTALERPGVVCLTRTRTKATRFGSEARELCAAGVVPKKAPRYNDTAPWHTSQNAFSSSSTALVVTQAR